MKHINKISKVEKIALAAALAGAINLDKKGYRSAGSILFAVEIGYCLYRMSKPIAENYIGVDVKTPDC